MTYFADLSPYRYLKVATTSAKLLNVGWLGKGHEFPSAEPEPEIVLKLARCCRQRVNQTRGFHICEFCREKRVGLPVEIEGGGLVLGSAEIRVQGEDGIAYACPDLIYHYVKDHHYCPPRQFLSAVQGERQAPGS